MKLEGTGSDNQFRLVPVGTAAIIWGLGAKDRNDCESALLRQTEYSVLVTHDDTVACVRTTPFGRPVVPLV